MNFMKTHTTHCNAKALKMNVPQQMISLYRFPVFKFHKQLWGMTLKEVNQRKQHDLFGRLLLRLS